MDPLQAKVMQQRQEIVAHLTEIDELKLVLRIAEIDLAKQRALKEQTD
jgi:hypothetical protein